MNCVFKNPTYQVVFDKQGFVIVDVLTDKECDEISAFHSKLNPQVTDNFYATQNSSNYGYRSAVESFLHPIFEEKIRNLFTNHRVLYTQYMVKHSGSKGECQLHQDWTFVNEPEMMSVNFWCALNDTDVNNGCLWFMPGSHKLKNYIRGRNIERASLKEQAFIRKYFLKPIELKKGQAVLFNCSILHESRDNKSGKDRIAAAAMIIPANVQPIHYMKNDVSDTKVVMIDADTRFYVDHSGNEMPEHFEIKRSLYLKPVSFTKTQLLLSYLSSII